MESILTVVLGATLGALFGFISARLQLPIQIKQTLSIKLFDKRAETYVLLYKILSDFLKILDFGKLSPEGITLVSREDVINFLREIEEWDSKNAIFLTPHSTVVCYKLRDKLYDLIKKKDQAISEELHNRKSYWTNSIRQLETSIKYDIGIYTIVPFPGIGGFNPVKDFKQAEETMKQIKGAAEDL